MKRLTCIVLLLALSGCITTGPKPVDYAQLYNNAVIALSVAEQGLATWELLATIQGRMTDAEISAHALVWKEKISALRLQVESLQKAIH